MEFTLKIYDRRYGSLFSDITRSFKQLGTAKLIDSALEQSRFDGELTLIGPNEKPIRYVCEANRRLDASALAPAIARLEDAVRQTNARPLLLSGYINDRVSEQLRREKIAYADAAGNMYFEEPGVYIWTRGFKSDERPERITRAFQAAGLQLVALLLATPEAIDWPYRKLAECAGLSLGSTSRVLSDLRGLGFIRLVAKDKNAVVNKADLLDRWQFGYMTRLRSRLKPQTYRQADEVPCEKLFQLIAPEMGDTFLVGGELAAAIATKHLRPQSVTLHIRRDRPQASLIKAMKLIPAPEGNITLVEQFGEKSAWAWPAYKVQRLIHPLLIYAELLFGKPDRRLVEMAKIVFDRFLAPSIDDERRINA